MITKYNWLNAGILLTIIADIIFLNIYVIQKITKNIIMEYEVINVWLIILSIVLVLLAIIKMVVFLTDKSLKKEE